MFHVLPTLQIQEQNKATFRLGPSIEAALPLMSGLKSEEDRTNVHECRKGGSGKGGSMLSLLGCGVRPSDWSSRSLHQQPQMFYWRKWKPGPAQSLGGWGHPDQECPFLLTFHRLGAFSLYQDENTIV